MSKLAINGGSPILKTPVTYPWPVVDADAESAVIDQLHRTICIYDKSGIVGEFEDAFGGLHGRKYALLTSSGTAALHSAYYALGIGPGDEVICPDYTFFATATPLFQLGAMPILADCGEDGAIDVQRIEELITPRTRAVVVTHMWGHPCDMALITAICRRHRLKLVEDCSHAHGAAYGPANRHKLVGTFGDIAIWSLQAQKIIAAGEGGILVTDDHRLYDRAQLLGHFNKRCLREMDPRSSLYPYATTGTGLKYRAHPLGVAFAASQLPHLSAWIAAKQTNAARMIQLIAQEPGMRLLAQSDANHLNAYYALTFLVDPAVSPYDRERLVACMAAEGFHDIDIPCSTAPLHTYPLFRDPISPVTRYHHRLPTTGYPVADRVAAQAVKVSVPVETDGRGLAFVDAFELVWSKVTAALKVSPFSTQ